MIYTYENLFVAYFSINGRFCLVSLKNPTFSNIFPRAKHVLMTFEFWTLCGCLCIFSLYISLLLLSSQQAPIDMWTISYPSPDDGYWNRNVNVDFTSWYIHRFGLYFFLQPSYLVYIYIYINETDTSYQIAVPCFRYRNIRESRATNHPVDGHEKLSPMGWSHCAYEWRLSAEAIILWWNVGRKVKCIKTEEDF